jgi:IS4 transposase
MPVLPVSLAALYDKLRRTEPAVLRGLVRGSAQRLAPVAQEIDAQVSLPGWLLRIVDGNHLPGSHKRLAPLRQHRGAALPGHSLVVYDPDQALVCDIVACEDAYESERIGVLPLIDSAQAGQLWIADRHFCTHAIMKGLRQAQAGMIVREHARHPRLAGQGDWSKAIRIDTGALGEQTIEIENMDGERSVTWRRIEIELDAPTEDNETVIRLWSNLPTSIEATTIAGLYRKRWRIEGMFERLESVLHSVWAILVRRCWA